MLGIFVFVLSLLLLSLASSWQQHSRLVRYRARPSSPFASRCRPTSISTRQKIVVYSDAGEGGGDLKAALNLLRKSAGVFSASAALEEELVEEEIERQLEEEERHERERHEQRRREQEAKKKEKNGDEPSDARQSTDLLKMKAEDVSISSTVNHTNTTEREMALQRRLDAFDRRAKRTRIILLKKIALWAFEVCATTVAATSTQRKQGDDGTKQSRKQYRVDRNAFYSGMLLVHLHLAKYVGVAACTPPTRVQVDELFELADHDGSGHLDEQEFTNAVIVACAPITSRIATYWSLLAVLPVVVGSTAGILARLMRHYVDRMPSSWYRRSLALMEWTVEQMLLILFFSILVPYMFNRIDRTMRQRAIEQARRRNRNTTLWWLRLSQPKKQKGGESLGKNVNGDDFAAVVKYWTEGLHNFVKPGMDGRWGDEDSGDSDKAEEREDTTSSQITRSWKRPWTFFAS